MKAALNAVALISIDGSWIYRSLLEVSEGHFAIVIKMKLVSFTLY